MLSGRFPETLFFSHDLIEGAHVQVGLASDIHRHDNWSNVPEIGTVLDQAQVAFQDRPHPPREKRPLTAI